MHGAAGTKLLPPWLRPLPKGEARLWLEVNTHIAGFQHRLEEKGVGLFAVSLNHSPWCLPWTSVPCLTWGCLLSWGDFSPQV